MSLDPDDPRPPYVQVANALRDAITSGTLRPGEKLPSGSDLAERYGVARMTVQNAIRCCAMRVWSSRARAAASSSAPAPTGLSTPAPCRARL